jgi:hypothetical protein
MVGADDPYRLLVIEERRLDALERHAKLRADRRS